MDSAVVQGRRKTTYKLAVVEGLSSTAPCFGLVLISSDVLEAIIEEAEPLNLLRFNGHVARIPVEDRVIGFCIVGVRGAGPCREVANILRFCEYWKLI